MKRLAGCVTLAVLCMAASISSRPSSAQARTLDIYFIDVEGGQATLVVTPAGETLLIDTGFPGDGTFSSRPADPNVARDAQRILAAANHAGIQRIDYLFTTHYHADHVGGVKELAQLLPIRAFIDHSAPRSNADSAVAGTQAIYDIYVQVRDNARHIQPKPGDKLPLKGVDGRVVATEERVLAAPGFGNGKPNADCAGTGITPTEKTENPRSTALRLKFGRFEFLDVGDLVGAPLLALTCPVNLLGEADLYLVSHHGGPDAADPAMFKSINPLVAVINNGPRKGGSAEVFSTLRQLPNIDVWQLHRSLIDGAENGPDERIANLDATTSAWIKVSARDDGSFSVTNARTGTTKQYRRLRSGS